MALYFNYMLVWYREHIYIYMQIQCIERRAE